MSIGIRPTILVDHARIEFDGEFSLEGVLPLCERCFQETAAAGREAMLVDVRKVTGPEPTMAERYQWAVRIAELQARHEPRIRVALVGREPLIHPERFGEVVATRGGAQLRTFTDEQMALEWLFGRPSR